MYLRDLVGCWQTVEIRTRILCRQFSEWWSGNGYVKMEDKGTDPMSDENGDTDEDEYDIV